jgi:hypothetical protein
MQRAFLCSTVQPAVLKSWQIGEVLMRRKPAAGVAGGNGQAVRWLASFPATIAQI